MGAKVILDCFKWPWHKKQDKRVWCWKYFVSKIAPCHTFKKVIWKIGPPLVTTTHTHDHQNSNEVGYWMNNSLKRKTKVFFCPGDAKERMNGIGSFSHKLWRLNSQHMLKMSKDIQRIYLKISLGKMRPFLFEDALLVFWFVNWFGSGTG